MILTNNNSSNIIVESKNKNASDEDALFNSIPTSGLKCDLLFKIIGDRMQDEPDLVEQLKAVFQYNITRDGKHATTWTADTKYDIGVYNSEPKNNVKPDCTVTVDDEDFVQIMVGKINPQRAFIMGKLNIKGNVLLLQRLNTLWTQLQAAGRAPELPLLASAVLNYKLIPNVKCDAMLVEMFIRMARMPQLIKDLKVKFTIHILKNNTNDEIVCYSLNLTEQTPSFQRGAGQDDNPNFEIFVHDDDFVRLMHNKLTIKDALLANRIRITGNIDEAYKLQPLFSTIKLAKL